MIGTRLSQFHIIAKLGEGGMGEVYRAEDTRLGREVAIKVLPDAVANDPERLARLEREARVLASLNHANIATLYGFESEGNTSFLVMELVEGETLAERIARGPVPGEEALYVARQIAEALAAAHDSGVVHRDLKPANIKITADDQVKVLDFGLAKAWKAASEEEPEGSDAALSDSPTLTARMTQAGVLLGTAAYMSPEQAKGRQVDARSDLWAFGCVLFEMLSGRQVFSGEDFTDTLAAVVRDEPEWNALPPRTPPSIAKLLRRCLEKDPRNRLHAAADGRIEIEEALDAPEVAPAPDGGAPGWRRIVVAALAGAVVVAMGMVLLDRSLDDESPNDQPIVRFSVPPPLGVGLSTDVEAHNLALSRDGSSLAFVVSQEGVRSIWLRWLDREKAERLAGTEGAHSPFWSPDGRSLAFFTLQELKVLRLDSGTTEVLCRASGVKTGAWGAHGTILFTQAFSDHDGLYRVAEGGGATEIVVESDREGDQGGQRWPVFLPDDDSFLYLASTSEAGSYSVSLYAGNLTSGKVEPLFPFRSRVEVVGNHLVYVQQEVLLARRFHFDELRFTGEAVPLAQGVPEFLTGWAPFAASRSGAVVYVAGSQESQLAWLDRSGHELERIGQPARYQSFRLSAAVDKVALEIQEGGDESDVWIHDFARGVRTRLTQSRGMESMPQWSSDGQRVLMAHHGIRGKDGDDGLFVHSLTGGEPERAAPETNQLQYASDWSRDGSWVTFWGSTADTEEDIWLAPIGGEGEPRARLDSRFRELLAVFSPDSRWLAYMSDESGRFEIYVSRTEGSDRGMRLSTDGGLLPRWRGDGKELFYLSGDDEIVAVPIDLESDTAVPGPPEVLFSLGPRGIDAYDVTPDGQRFLVMVADNQDRSLHVILNWAEPEEPE